MAVGVVDVRHRPRRVVPRLRFRPAAAAATAAGRAGGGYEDGEVGAGLAAELRRFDRDVGACT